MTKKFFTSALASGILALSMGANAMAADVNGTSAKSTQKVTLEAGTNPTNMELHFSGAQRVSFYDAGTLQITKTDGSTWKYRPNLSQDVNGKRKYLVPEFRIVGKDRVALSVSKIDDSAPVLLDGKGPNS